MNIECGGSLIIGLLSEGMQLEMLNSEQYAGLKLIFTNFLRKNSTLSTLKRFSLKILSYQVVLL